MEELGDVQARKYSHSRRKKHPLVDVQASQQTVKLSGITLRKEIHDTESDSESETDNEVDATVKLSDTESDSESETENEVDATEMPRNEPAGAPQPLSCRFPSGM